MENWSKENGCRLAKDPALRELMLMKYAGEGTDGRREAEGTLGKEGG